MVPVGNTAKRLSSVNHTIKAIHHHHHHHHHHHIQKLLQVLNFTVATTQFTQKCDITNITKSGFLIHLKRILHFFKNTNYKYQYFHISKKLQFLWGFFYTFVIFLYLQYHVSEPIVFCKIFNIVHFVSLYCPIFCPKRQKKILKVNSENKMYNLLGSYWVKLPHFRANMSFFISFVLIVMFCITVKPPNSGHLK